MIIPGRFIVIEGLEGAGKTTALATVQEYLNRVVSDVIVTREPGGTTIGEKLRRLIKEPVAGESLDARCELLMMYAARVQLLEQVIRPALSNGTWVLADRFELSTYAYQGGGRGIDKQIIDDLSTVCLQGFKPDLTIFLDIAPEQGLERVNQRGQTDRIEQESLVFFNKVYQAYHQAIGGVDNVRIINASASLEQVQQAIVQQLDLFFSNNAHFTF